MQRHACVSLMLASLLSQPGYSAPYSVQTKTDVGCVGIDLERGAEVVIDSLEFQDDASLPPEMKRKIRKAVAKELLTVHASTDWTGHIGDVARNEAQANGYFKAVVEPSSGLIRAEADRLRYWVSLKVDLGQQYQLGQVRFADSRFADAPIFAESRLRAQIPIEQGELFSVTKVREGLENLRRLFVRIGYIDFTAEPQTNIDEDAHRIDLTLILDQERQYRVGGIDVRGFDTAHEQQLRDKFTLGEIFDGTAIHEFFQANSTSLPPGTSEENSVWIRRYVDQGTVRITFEQHSCEADRSSGRRG